MKKYLSVFMLFTRSTIFPMLALLIAMVATEGALFWLAMEKNIALEQTFSLSRISWAGAVYFVLLTVILSSTGSERGAKTGYFLRRLQISERSVFLCQGAYNTICYFIFWMAQLFIVLGLFHYYIVNADPSYIGSQSIFLAFYRDSFLHSLLPLAETSRYVRNGILILGLGISSAYYPMSQRTGKSSMGIIALVCVILPFFARGIGSLGSDILLSAFAIIMVLKIFLKVFEKDSPYEAGEVPYEA